MILFFIFVFILISFISNSFAPTPSVNSSDVIEMSDTDSDSFESVDDFFDPTEGESNESSNGFEIIGGTPSIDTLSEDISDLPSIASTIHNNTISITNTTISNKPPPKEGDSTITQDNNINIINDNKKHNIDTTQPFISKAVNILTERIPEYVLLPHILQENEQVMFNPFGISSGQVENMPQFCGIKFYNGIDNKKTKYYGHQLYYYTVLEDSNTIGINYLMQKIISGALGTIQNDSVSLFYSTEILPHVQWKNVFIIGNFSRNVNGHIIGLHTQFNHHLPLKYNATLIPQWGVMYYNTNARFINSDYKKLYKYHYSDFKNIFGISLQSIVNRPKFDFIPEVNYQIFNHVYHHVLNESSDFYRITINRPPFTQHRVGMTFSVVPQYLMPMTFGYSYTWHKKYYNNGVFIQLKFSF